MQIKILPILLLLSLARLSAQNTMSYLEVDTTTYNAYLVGNWDKIVEVGNKALKNNVDYYYLRMRLGYALFMENKYMLAEKHYKKALEFSKQDPTALEYLYYCYINSGRVQDSEKLIKQFPKALKTSLQIADSNKLTEISFYVSHSTGASDEVKKEIIATAPNNLNGDQIAPNSSMNYNLNLKHKIGRSININHSFHFINKDELSWAVVNSTPYLSESQIVKQYTYNLGIKITPLIGFTLKPFASIIHYKIPVFFDYGAGMGKDRQIYNYNSFTDFTVGLKTNKHIGMFDIGLAGVYSELNNSRQTTGAALLSIYPFNNLNFYYTGKAFLHSQNSTSTRVLQLMHSHELGFKIWDNLWLELFTLWGEHSNFQDPFSELNYNSLELNRSASGIKLIVPFYKSGVTLFASYRYQQSESMFVPTDNPLNTTNHIKFNYQTITGGIIWKL